MTEYNFHNFDDYEFELLCRDILNDVQRLDIKSNHGLDYQHVLSFSNFKRGKDGGVDLYFEKEEIKVVGQVKLSRGKFADLFSSIKKKKNGINELAKVKKLNPSKYIFMTSAPLSLANKRILMEYFSPYIITINDIFGKEDLNAFLTRFKHIEKNYVKLYFSNPLILERLLNQATLTGSAFTQKEIHSQLNLFVQTENYTKALSTLEKQNLLIIKGLPGVGKTTLANMLSLYYIERGYKFIEILELDNEIERLIDADEEKCIFYYDDFLGSNSLIISDALKNEGRLNRLLRRIAQKRNKALIMTTRTNILKQAEFYSEKLKRVFNIISKYEVEITNLSFYEKQKILENHINKNELDPEIFRVESLFDKITKHSNFSPRLIEFVTDKSNYINQKTNYYDFVISSLNFPREIWSYAYNFQISYVDKLYLNHLFLFGNSCSKKKFVKSFSNRLSYEVKNNNYSISSREFKESTSTMDGTFITLNSRLHLDKIYHDIEFINPSIIDYLLKEIKQNTSFIRGSISNFDDGDLFWNRFNHYKKELLKLYTKTELSKVLLSSERIELFHEVKDKIKYLNILLNYFSCSEIEIKFSKEIKNILSTEIDFSNFDVYSEFLLSFQSSGVVSSYNEKNGARIINELLVNIDYLSELDNILDMFNLFNIDLNSYLKNKDNKNLIFESLDRIFSEVIEQIIFEQDDILSHKDVNELRQQTHELYNDYESIFQGLDDMITRILDENDWDSLIKFHQFKNDGIQ